MKKSGLAKQIDDIGRMDRKISIESITFNTDTLGGKLEQKTIKKVWAHVAYSAEKEDEFEYVKSINETVIFTIRFRPMNHKDRILYNGKEYEIEKIEEIGRKRFLKIHGNATK